MAIVTNRNLHGIMTYQKLMPARPHHPAKRPNRHPRPPDPSRLKPAQYARLSLLVGDTPDRTNHFYRECRERLAKCSYGEFSTDDLIDEALLRLFLGRKLPKGMSFPKTQDDLIKAVERLGTLHVQNTERGHRRHGPRPVSLDESLHANLIAQASPKQSTSLQTMQLDILRRLEDQLVKRIAQIESSNKPSKTDSERPMESKIELF